MKLQGKVALVTGAGQGIGRAVLHRLVREGARVVAVELSEAAAAEAAAGLDAAALRMLCRDATLPATVDESVRTALGDFGRLDILVNVAARFTERSALDTDDAAWASTIDGALGTTFRYCRAVLQPMIDAGGGSIVNVASINQIVANPGLAAYTAAKGGVAALTRQIAIEYGVRGIRCNCVSPALIATARTMNGVSERDMRLNRESYPLGRVGRPEDVAAAVAFLASDDAAFITAVDLPVDGGLTSLAASALLSTRIRGWWGRKPIDLPDPD